MKAIYPRVTTIISVALVSFFLRSEIRAQVTPNLSVEAVKAPNAKITEVELTDDLTYVTVEYAKTKGNWSQAWVSFASTIYIEDRRTGLKYLIRKLADGDQLDTRYETKDKKGSIYSFRLVFPRLPPGVENIDVIEPFNGGFRWLDVRIKNPVASPMSGCANTNSILIGKAESVQVVRNFLEVSSDRISFVGKKVGSNGLLRISDLYLFSFHEAQTTHFSFEAVDDDGKSRGYFYFRRGDSSTELRRQFLDSKYARVCGYFEFEIPQNGFDVKSQYLIAELLVYAPPRG